MFMENTPRGTKYLNGFQDKPLDLKGPLVGSDTTTGRESSNRHSGLSQTAEQQQPPPYRQTPTLRPRSTMIDKESHLKRGLNLARRNVMK